MPVSLRMSIENRDFNTGNRSQNVDFPSACDGMVVTVVNKQERIRLLFQVTGEYAVI